MSKIELYIVGPLSMSVCAPKDMDTKIIINQAEAQNPAGTSNGWAISDDKNFASGHPMPCQCEDNPTRQHWLLEV